VQATDDRLSLYHGLCAVARLGVFNAEGLPLWTSTTVDLSLHEIEQMALVAIKAHESLVGSDTAEGFFQMPAEDAELLIFSTFDIS